MEKLENSRNLWGLSSRWVEGPVSAPRSELSEPREASAPTSGKQSQAIHSLHFPPKHQKHQKLPRPGPEEVVAPGDGTLRGPPDGVEGGRAAEDLVTGEAPGPRAPHDALSERCVAGSTWTPTQAAESVASPESCR